MQKRDVRLDARHPGREFGRPTCRNTHDASLGARRAETRLPSIRSAGAQKRNFGLDAWRPGRESGRPVPRIEVWPPGVQDFGLVARRPGSRSGRPTPRAMSWSCLFCFRSSFQ
ncbi:hypothetical protein Rs2_41062 [Raphanus sativus]|nr:hypothetical protein Rs2_41062 [Raphanus sativus]